MGDVVIVSPSPSPRKPWFISPYHHHHHYYYYYCYHYYDTLALPAFFLASGLEGFLSVVGEEEEEGVDRRDLGYNT